MTPVMREMPRTWLASWRRSRRHRSAAQRGHFVITSRTRSCLLQRGTVSGGHHPMAAFFWLGTQAGGGPIK